MTTRLLILCLVLYLPSIAQTANKANEEARLAELQKRIRSTSVNLKKLRSKQHVIESELQTLDTKHGKTAKAVEELANQSLQLKQQLTDIQSKKSHAGQQSKKSQLQLSKQMRAAYFSGRREQVRLLMNITEPAKMARHLVYYQHLGAARLHQLKAIQTQLSALETAELEKREVDKTLASTLEKTQAEQSKLNSIQQQRSAVLKGLKKKISKQDKKLTALKRDEKQLQALIKSIQDSLDALDLNVINKLPFARLKSKLTWPLKNIRSSELRLVNGKRQGLVMQAEQGSSVYAVASGRVVFADWMPGYGLMIMIDHGSNYITLYANNQDLHGKIGESIKAGQRIASVGQSGGQPQPALYFEIRKKAQAQDPLRWLSKKKN